MFQGSYGIDDGDDGGIGVEVGSDRPVGDASLERICEGIDRLRRDDPLQPFGEVVGDPGVDEVGIELSKETFGVVWMAGPAWTALDFGPIGLPEAASAEIAAKLSRDASCSSARLRLSSRLFDRVACTGASEPADFIISRFEGLFLPHVHQARSRILRVVRLAE